MTRSVAKSSRVAEQCEVNIHSLTRGLLETDLSILSIGQMTRMTLELASHVTTPRQLENSTPRQTKRASATSTRWNSSGTRT
ncbi:hypothetical protein TNCV_1667161 [Trichonephila clavipes]|nr:hypothetical protein TNCV_1667161 [Trichonephila clavipes]